MRALDDGPSKALSLRVPEGLHESLSAWADASKLSVSELSRYLLEGSLQALEQNMNDSKLPLTESQQVVAEARAEVDQTSVDASLLISETSRTARQKTEVNAEALKKIIGMLEAMEGISSADKEDLRITREKMGPGKGTLKIERKSNKKPRRKPKAKDPKLTITDS